MIAVASVVLACGVAQWPHILPERLTVSAAAVPTGPTGTSVALLVVVGLAAVIVIPALLHRAAGGGAASGGAVDAADRRVESARPE